MQYIMPIVPELAYVCPNPHAHDNDQPIVLVYLLYLWYDF